MEEMMPNMTIKDQEVTEPNHIRLNTDYSQWITVRQFCLVFPWPSEPGLRALIHGAFVGNNSFKSAFRKVGRRVLVNPSRLFAAIDDLNDCPSSGAHTSSSLQKGGKYECSKEKR